MPQRATRQSLLRSVATAVFSIPLAFGLVFSGFQAHADMKVGLVETDPAGQKINSVDENNKPHWVRAGPMDGFLFRLGNLFGPSHSAPQTPPPAPAADKTAPAEQQAEPPKAEAPQNGPALQEQGLDNKTAANTQQAPAPSLPAAGPAQGTPAATTQQGADKVYTFKAADPTHGPTFADAAVKSGASRGAVKAIVEAYNKAKFLDLSIAEPEELTIKLHQNGPQGGEVTSVAFTIGGRTYTDPVTMTHENGAYTTKASMGKAAPKQTTSKPKSAHPAKPAKTAKPTEPATPPKAPATTPTHTQETTPATPPATPAPQTPATSTPPAAQPAHPSAATATPVSLTIGENETLLQAARQANVPIEALSTIVKLAKANGIDLKGDMKPLEINYEATVENQVGHVTSAKVFCHNGAVLSYPTLTEAEGRFVLPKKSLAHGMAKALRDAKTSRRTPKPAPTKPTAPKPVQTKQATTPTV
jgi:hypothetical protein